MSNALHENLANVRIETDDGDLLPAMDVAGERLAQLILAVSANQKPGTLTLKITVRPSTAGALAVKADVRLAPHGSIEKPGAAKVKLVWRAMPDIAGLL